MSITVRSPNGQAVRYNEARYVTWDVVGGARLWAAETGSIIGRVLPHSVSIVEFTRPCEMTNPLKNPDEAIRIVIQGIRGAKNLAAVRDLKRELQHFDAKRWSWKT
jgi:hypothetical protein